MIAVRLLPEIKIFAHSISVPCPDLDFVRLGIALSQAGDKKAQQVSSVLADSPSLLLFSLHHFFCERDASPDSAKQLAPWFADYFQELAAKIHFNFPVSEKKHSQRFVVSPDSIRGLSNRELKKSLVKYAKSLPGTKDASIKNWVKTIVGASISGESFSTSQVPIQKVFQLSGQICAMEAQFEARLLDEKLEAMKQLAYGASHEINNPLANISTRAQSLLVVEDNPERRRKLAVIYEQAIRAHDMISDMMLFAHPPELNLEHVEVGEIVKQVLQEMRLAIRQRNAQADLKIYPGVKKASLDKTQFSVALKALIRNSLESIEARESSEGGRIIVRIWPEYSETLSVSVADNGAGIAKNAEKHLFDPFFSGREAGRGLGFGLSKAWRIAQLHSGELVWDRAYQAGTQFTMRLPSKRKISTSRIDKSRAA